MTDADIKPNYYAMNLLNFQRNFVRLKSFFEQPSDELHFN